MHKNVINTGIRSALLLSLGVALASVAFVQTSARAETAHDSYLSKVSDDGYRHQDRGRYDYHDGRTAHEGHGYYERDHQYSHEDAERARRERAHHEHEEREQRGQRGHYEH